MRCGIVSESGHAPLTVRSRMWLVCQQEDQVVPVDSPMFV